MPNGDYMEPTNTEKRRNRVCNHIVFLAEATGKYCPKWATQGSRSIYGYGSDLIIATAKLARMCEAADETIIYNARDSRARDLAGWWEAHQGAKAREAEREVRQARQRLVRDAADAMENLLDHEIVSFISLAERTVTSRLAAEQRELDRRKDD
jgi:hypothetical protein